MSDGTFRLFYRRGWAWLAVTAPAGAGRPVYPEEIQNRMRLLRVPRVSLREIQDRIERAAGVAERLVEWPEGEQLAARITVTVADDQMSASITVEAPRKGAAPPEVEDLEEELRRHGVTFGVDRRTLRRILAGERYGRAAVVARGRAPVYGSSRRVAYHFNTNRGRPWLEMEFGRINLKELNFVANCSEGDLLAELLPPVAPVDGATVTGEMIPAVRDDTVVRLQAGSNTRLNPDASHLYADSDGNARLLDDGTVTVEPMIVVQSVNYETGNIYFDGTVVVEGSVADGFIVEAGGDIEVGKGVGRATLKAGGSILLKTGINGNDEGLIECGGNLLARYLERCTVTCRGNLLVEEAIMHSRVIVWNHCVLNGRRAECIGGDAIVGGSFWCRKLGNFNEVTTRLAAGVAPNRMLNYRSTRQNLDSRRRELDKTEQQLDQCRKAIRDGHENEKVLLARDQLQVNAERIAAELTDLNRDVRSLRDQLAASRKSIVVVEDELFKGVTVLFGTREYRAPEKGARRTILKLKDGEIRDTGFDPQNRPVLSFEEPAVEKEPAADRE